MIYSARACTLCSTRYLIALGRGSRFLRNLGGGSSLFLTSKFSHMGNNLMLFQAPVFSGRECVLPTEYTRRRRGNRLCRRRGATFLAHCANVLVNLLAVRQRHGCRALFSCVPPFVQAGVCVTSTISSRRQKTFISYLILISQDLILLRFSLA